MPASWQRQYQEQVEEATEGASPMMTMMRAIALCAALLVSGSAFAQQYPTKPVKIIIPFPAGGVTDLAGRLIAQKLSERLGQQFYIENIGGAGGNIGMAQVARSPGDGYTVLLSSSSVTVNPSLYSQDAVRRGEGPDPGHQGRRLAELLAGQPELPGQEHEGTGRSVQEGTRQIQRRLARRRHHAVAVDRAAQARSQGQFRHRAVRRRRTDDAIAARRPRRRSSCGAHRQLGGADQGRQAPRARHHRRRSAWRRCPTSRRSTKWASRTRRPRP